MPADGEYILPAVSKRPLGTALGDDVAQSGETLPPAIFERDCRRVEPLLDLFPESAAILNVWENKLALVKGERAGPVAATER